MGRQRVAEMSEQGRPWWAGPMATLTMVLGGLVLVVLPLYLAAEVLGLLL